MKVLSKSPVFSYLQSLAKNIMVKKITFPSFTQNPFMRVKNITFLSLTQNPFVRVKIITLPSLTQNPFMRVKNITFPSLTQNPFMRVKNITLPSFTQNPFERKRVKETSLRSPSRPCSLRVSPHISAVINVNEGRPKKLKKIKKLKNKIKVSRRPELQFACSCTRLLECRFNVWRK